MNRLAGVEKALPLDRVYSRGLRVRYTGVLPYDSSDHRPIVVKFELIQETPEFSN